MGQVGDKWSVHRGPLRPSALGQGRGSRSHGAVEGGFHPISLPLFRDKVSLCTVTLHPALLRAGPGSTKGWGEGLRGEGKQKRRGSPRSVQASMRFSVCLCCNAASRVQTLLGLSPLLPHLSSSSSLEILVNFKCYILLCLPSHSL